MRPANPPPPNTSGAAAAGPLLPAIGQQHPHGVAVDDSGAAGGPSGARRGRRWFPSRLFGGGASSGNNGGAAAARRTASEPATLRARPAVVAAPAVPTTPAAPAVIVVARPPPSADGAVSVAMYCNQRGGKRTLTTPDGEPQMAAVVATLRAASRTDDAVWMVTPGTTTPSADSPTVLVAVAGRVGVVVAFDATPAACRTLAGAPLPPRVRRYLSLLLQLPLTCV